MMAQGDEATRGYTEPAIVETEPGRLLAVYRLESVAQGQEKVLWWNESTNSGKSWTDPQPLPFLAGACPRLHKLSDGRILMTYGRRLPPVGLYACLSRDGGRSWSERPLLLRATPDGNQGYSSSVELDDGSIFTANYSSKQPARQTGAFRANGCAKPRALAATCLSAVVRAGRRSPGLSPATRPVSLAPFGGHRRSKPAGRVVALNACMLKCRNPIDRIELGCGAPAALKTFASRGGAKAVLVEAPRETPGKRRLL